mgnify:CR=1 FL=1
MKRHKIAPELKEQIINRIKNDGITVVQAAKDHGVSEGTIFMAGLPRRQTYNQICQKLSG